MPRTLAQNAQYIAETIKPAIKSAIEAQGVTVPSTDSFLDYADRIGEIEGGGSGYQLKDLPTGSIATVTDAAELPLNALKVSVEAWQEGSGDPSPSNIRPIHGWDSGTINIDGINQWDENFGYIGGAYYGSIDYIPVKPNTQYYIKSPYNMYLLYFDSDKTQLGNSNWAKNYTLTTRADCYYLKFYIDPAYGTTYNNDISINYPSSDTSYHAYNGKTYSHAFTDAQGNPLTIYGAEWDVTDGELKQTDGYIASYNGESLPSTWISDRDVYASGTTPTIGAEVVYKLATPTTINLSPLSIRMLQGTNNVYADCGEVIEGEYFVDEGAIDVRKVDYQIGSSGSIKTTDGRVLSGFASMSGYHARPLDASGNWLDVDWSKDFEIGVSFKFTAFPAYQGITGDGNYNSWRKAPRLDYDDSQHKINLCVSSDGSTLAIDAYIDYTIVVDTWYFVKLKFVKSTMALTVDITEDFDTYTSGYSGTLASTPYHDAASLCFGGDAQQSDMTSNTFLIDTFNTYIKGDGVNWGAFTGVFPS